MYLYDIVSRFRIRKTVGARKAARCTADAILRGFFFFWVFSILFLFFFIFFCDTRWKSLYDYGVVTEGNICCLTSIQKLEGSPENGALVNV